MFFCRSNGMPNIKMEQNGLKISIDLSDACMIRWLDYCQLHVLVSQHHCYWAVHLSAFEEPNSKVGQQRAGRRLGWWLGDTAQIVKGAGRWWGNKCIAPQELRPLWKLWTWLESWLALTILIRDGGMWMSGKLGKELQQLDHVRKFNHIRLARQTGIDRSPLIRDGLYRSS